MRSASHWALRGLILALAMTLIDEKQYRSAVLQLLGLDARVKVWSFRLRTSHDGIHSGTDDEGVTL